MAINPYAPQQTDMGNEFQGGSRWNGGALQTAAPGYGWDASGNYVNISQAQMGQQAQQQAQQDLAGLGSPAQIASQSAAAADPFANQRGQYQNSLANLMNGQFSTSDPSYAWRVGQGQQALERSAAAKGYLGSGNILAELQNYGQGQGSQEYQNQFNRLLPLTGAQSGSPAAAGSAIAATYGWRNNALANLGGAQQLQSGMSGMGGGGTSGSSLQFPGQVKYATNQGYPVPGGAGGSPFGGSSGGSMSGGGGMGMGGGSGGGMPSGAAPWQTQPAYAPGDPHWNVPAGLFTPQSPGFGAGGNPPSSGGGNPGATPVGGTVPGEAGHPPSSEHGEGWMWTGTGWQRTQ